MDVREIFAMEQETRPVTVSRAFRSESPSYAKLRRRLAYLCRDFVSQSKKMGIEGEGTIMLARLLAETLVITQESKPSVQEVIDVDSLVRVMYGGCPSGVCD